MKKLITLSLVLVSLASTLTASANIGAAINKRNGRIQYAIGNDKLENLVAAAIEGCKSDATMDSLCEPVGNETAKCEKASRRKPNFGRLARNHDDNGWKGFLACGKDSGTAQDKVKEACGANCTLDQELYDEGN